MDVIRRAFIAVCIILFAVNRNIMNQYFKYATIIGLKGWNRQHVLTTAAGDTLCHRLSY